MQLANRTFTLRIASCLATPPGFSQCNFQIGPFCRGLLRASQGRWGIFNAIANRTFSLRVASCLAMTRRQLANFTFMLRIASCLAMTRGIFNAIANRTFSLRIASCLAMTMGYIQRNCKPHLFAEDCFVPRNDAEAISKLSPFRLRLLRASR